MTKTFRTSGTRHVDRKWSFCVLCFAAGYSGLLRMASETPDVVIERYSQTLHTQTKPFCFPNMSVRLVSHRIRYWRHNLRSCVSWDSGLTIFEVHSPEYRKKLPRIIVQNELSQIRVLCSASSSNPLPGLPRIIPYLQNFRRKILLPYAVSV